MRYFKFIGLSCDSVDGHPENGNIYSEKYNDWGHKHWTVLQLANAFPKEWKEVFENQSPWISVSDRLPEVEIDILIFDGKDLYIGYLRGNKFLSDNEYLYSSNVTHWMPLPEPPVK